VIALRLRDRLASIEPNTVQRWFPVFVALVAIAVYFNSLWNGFAYDDTYIVQHNSRVHDLSAWRNIWLKPYWPFHGVHFGIYRPFVIFMYAVQWALTGGEPWLFHVVNVVLHAIASILAYYILARLTARGPALVGALIFAVHPVHTEVVANVVGQAELIAAIGLLSACLIHITRPAGVAVSWPRRVAYIPLFAVAIATKENSVILPGLLVALDFAQKRVHLSARGIVQYARVMLMPLFLLGATLVAYLIVRFDVMSGTIMGVDANPSLPFLREPDRVLNALRAFPEFARLLFFPLDLAADYAPGVTLAVDSWTGLVLLGALLLSSLTLLAVATPWLPAAGLPAAWFLISMIVVSNLFFPIGVLIAERTLYLPSFAVSIMVAHLWQSTLPKAAPITRRMAPAVMLIVLVLFGIRTWTRNPAWKDTDAVFRTLSRDYPQSYRAQWAQASILWRRGDLQQAGLRFAFAQRMYPRDAHLTFEHASFLLETGRREEARVLFERSHKMMAYVARTSFMLALTYSLEGRNQEALALLTEAEQRDVSAVISMPLRANIYHGMGEHDKAVAAWRVAVAHSANTQIVWAFLARTLAIAGYEQESLRAAEHGIRIARDTADQRKYRNLRSVIMSGCYRGLAQQEPPASGVFQLPACDPIGNYLDLVIRHAEIASAMQNASLPALDSAVAMPGGSGQAVKSQ
jgi:tetratricopeptide (TPR) repeat protein